MTLAEWAENCAKRLKYREFQDIFEGSCNEHLFALEWRTGVRRRKECRRW